MKNKLFFRIFGALASGLLIFAFFAPYSNTYSTTLWDGLSASDMSYVPIMLIALGVLSAILFAANTKLELVNISFGASLFFLVMQTFSAIDTEAFEYLGMGYYFLLIGTLTMGVMSFICNSGKATQNVAVSTQAPVQGDIVSRMETLYGDNQQQPIVQPMIIEPMIQPVEQPIMSNPVTQNIQQPIMPNPVTQNIQQPLNETVSATPEQPIAEPINQPINMNTPIPEITEVVPNGNIPNNGIPTEAEKPAMQPLNAIPAQQPVAQIQQQPLQMPATPEPSPSISIQPPISIQPVGIEQANANTVNPVVSEFSNNAGSNPQIVQQVQTAPQPVSQTPQQPAPPTVGMDIFGQ